MKSTQTMQMKTDNHRFFICIFVFICKNMYNRAHRCPKNTFHTASLGERGTRLRSIEETGKIDSLRKLNGESGNIRTAAQRPLERSRSWGMKLTDVGNWLRIMPLNINH